MADWYVYQHDGDPLGPWSTDDVANAILAGKLAPDVWVAAPGGPRWLRALDVPVIGRLVEGIPTRPRRDSGLRLIPGAFTTEGGLVSFGSTMMIVKDDELELAEVAPPATAARVEDPASSGAPATTRSHSFAPSPTPVSGTEDTVQVQVPTRAVETVEMAARTPRGPFAASTPSDDAPPTDPAMPPESTTPSLPPTGRAVSLEERDAAAGSPSSDRRRRRKGA